jgi:hypothetical protein
LRLFPSRLPDGIEQSIIIAVRKSLAGRGGCVSFGFNLFWLRVVGSIDATRLVIGMIGAVVIAIVVGTSGVVTTGDFV